MNNTQIEKIIEERCYVEYCGNGDPTNGHKIKLSEVGKKELTNYIQENYVSKSSSKKIETEIVHKLLASINSFLAENGLKDTDGTSLTFSPERIKL